MGTSDDEQRGDVQQIGGIATEIKPVGGLGRYQCGTQAALAAGMPFRASKINQYCGVCEMPTTEACRRCRRPLCPAHATEYAFYTPTLECIDAQDCSQRQQNARPATAGRHGDRWSIRSTAKSNLPIFAPIRRLIG